MSLGMSWLGRPSSLATGEAVLSTSVSSIVSNFELDAGAVDHITLSREQPPRKWKFPGRVDDLSCARYVRFGHAWSAKAYNERWNIVRNARHRPAVIAGLRSSLVHREQRNTRGYPAFNRFASHNRTRQARSRIIQDHAAMPFILIPTTGDARKRKLHAEFTHSVLQCSVFPCLRPLPSSTILWIM